MTSGVATYLDRIVAAHRELARADTRRLDRLTGEAQAQPPARGFAAALRTVSGLGVIAEVKRRSPSKGDLHAPTSIPPSSPAPTSAVGPPASPC